jgi:hypothetical protein
MTGAMGSPRRPITPAEVERAPQREFGRLSVHELLEHWQKLSSRGTYASAIETLKARGEYDPAKHGDAAETPPLTAQEHLTVLALGEAIARIVRHPVQVDEAVKAGASWEQIAAASGQSEDAARQAYCEWADGQRSLREHYGKFGMTAEEHAAAIGRAEDRQADGEAEAGQ